MAQLIKDWKADYTGADTNLPLQGASPTVGPELREVKAVIRGETLNKHFSSDKINAFRIPADPDDYFYVDAADLGGAWPSDADILPGETMLLTLNDPDPAEYWAVVKTVVLGPGQVKLTVFTGVHLNGTDGTLSHMRRSVYKVPAHPSHVIDPAYNQTLGQVSSLPARVCCMYARCRATVTSVKVGFPFKLPAAGNVRIFGTVISHTGTPPVGAYVIKSITRDEVEATITFQAAAPFEDIEWLFTVYIE